MKRGQVSTEFLIIVGVILLIFVTILFFSLSRRADVRETETYLGANSECLKFSNLISAAYVGGDGTEIKTKTNYLISFYNYSAISVKSLEEEKASCVFYAKIPSYHNLSGDILIKNVGNEIIIENVTAS